MDYKKRQKKIFLYLKDKHLDALLVRDRYNIKYLTGTRGEDSILYISPRATILITDPRYKEEYKKEGINFHIHIYRYKNILKAAAEICIEHSIRQIGFERSSFSYADYILLKGLLGKKIGLTPVNEVIENFRMIKDDEEIACIKKACGLGKKVMDYALRFIRPDLTEKYLAGKIESYINKLDTKKAFDIIVASGTNSSMPHAPVSTRQIKKNEMVLIDLGCNFNGYNSDLTRTIFIGKMSSVFLKLYNIVKDAQRLAIESIKPGVPARDIDNLSRKYIKDKGVGRYFVHSLGHGIGLQAHEKPPISINSETRLQKDMVVTIEPGIYIPKWGGIRIEDDILITESGAEILTG